MKKTAIILAISAAFAGAVVHAQETSTPPSEWAIKGIKLGASQADVVSAFPSAQCKQFDDSAIKRCYIESTLAEKPALLNVRFLNDQAVYIAVENLDYPQAEDGIAGLAAKYGQPTRRDEVRVRMTFKKASNVRIIERPIWEAGDVKMYLSPADWTDERKDITYSAVILENEPKHRGEWQPRFERKGKPAASDI